MSIFSRIESGLGDLKKIKSVAHIGNGVSAAALAKLVEVRLVKVPSLTSVTSSLTKGISGANLTSGVLSGPISKGKL